MKKIIRFLVINPLTWAVLNSFYKLFYRFKFEKDMISIENRRERVPETQRRKVERNI